MARRRAIVPRATTTPGSTTEPHARRLAAFLLPIAFLLAGCGSWTWGRRPASPAGIVPEDRQDPALSGNGALLASIVERGGLATVVLQQQPSGRIVPLPLLRRHQPHSSPALSWNGRYLAVLVQQGSRRLAVIEDRAAGRLHRLPLPGDQEPERLSLSPDGRRLALAVLRNGRTTVQMFDLSGLLEPDLPAGVPAGPNGGGEAAPP